MSGAPIPVYVHLRRAKDLADRHYDQPLDIPALARAALVSPAHFNRSFKSAFGETPHRYLRSRRIERAQELLRGTDETVTAICLSVGFQSLGSFSAIFSRHVGESPSGYRRRWRGDPAGAAAAAAVPACYGLMWTRPVAPADRAVSKKAAGGGAASVTGVPEKEVATP